MIQAVRSFWLGDRECHDKLGIIKWNGVFWIGYVNLASLLSTTTIPYSEQLVTIINTFSVVISTGNTTQSAAGAIRLDGGSSEEGNGGDIDILSGKSTFGVGGRILLRTLIDSQLYFSVSALLSLASKIV